MTHPLKSVATVDKSRRLANLFSFSAAEVSESLPSGRPISYDHAFFVADSPAVRRNAQLREFRPGSVKLLDFGFLRTSSFPAPIPTPLCNFFSPPTTPFLLSRLLVTSVVKGIVCYAWATPDFTLLFYVATNEPVCRGLAPSGAGSRTHAFG